MTIDPEAAGDLRRGAALITHHITSDGDGINAILQEALNVKRVGPLIQAIVTSFDGIVPQLVTHAGQTAMAQMILITANDEHEDETRRRAARFLLACGHSTDEMKHILSETDDISPTIIALLNLYADIMPILHTPLGLELLNRAAITLAGMEDEDDQ